MSAGREKQTLTSWNRNLLAKAREGGGRRVPVRGEKRREEQSTQGGSALSTRVQHTPGCGVWGDAGDAPEGLRRAERCWPTPPPRNEAFSSSKGSNSWC